MIELRRKVLIVDDDYLVLEYLRRIIGQHTETYEIVGEAPNGRSALELIRQQTPDICITDISMPIMSGIELIREVKTLGLKLKFIVLSCHDDFDYLKEALALGASEYILKQRMKADELVAILDQVNQVMVEEAGYVQSALFTNKFVNIYTPVVKERFVRQLIAGGCKNEQDIIEKKELLKISMNVNKAVVVLTDIHLDPGNPFLQDKDLLGFALLNIINEIIDQSYNGLCSRTESDEIVSIIDFGVSSEKDAYSSAFQFADEIGRSIRRFFKTETVTLFSGNGNGFKSIPDSFSRLTAAIKNKHFFRERKILSLEEAENYKDYWYNWYLNMEKDLLTVVSEGEHAEMAVMLPSCIRLWNTNRKDSRDSLSIYLQLLFTLSTIVEEHELSISEVYETTQSPYFTVREMVEEQTMIEWLVKLYQNACKLIANKTKHLRSEIVMALDYMEKNIDRRISLNDVAVHINISRTHFSKIFKQETGRNFVDYVMELKIDKSKKLLKEGRVKVNEVADKVGFSDTGYFIKAFKDIVGRTPKEYQSSE